MTFGDTIRGDHVRSEEALAQIGDVPRVPGSLLYDIMVELIRLHRGLRVMKLECLKLEEAGMWPAVPSESWESRNGSDPIYLRLVFPSGCRGSRKLYIGCKSEKIADARRKMANRLRWEELDAAAAELERVLRSAERQLKRQHWDLARYELPLGTAAGGREAVAVTKEGE